MIIEGCIVLLVEGNIVIFLFGLVVMIVGICFIRILNFAGVISVLFVFFCFGTLFEEKSFRILC